MAIEGKIREIIKIEKRKVTAEEKGKVMKEFGTTEVSPFTYMQHPNRKMIGTSSFITPYRV